jgi:hypothetical protein
MRTRRMRRSRRKKVAPLIKSRDPHLAGEEMLGQFCKNYPPVTQDVENPPFVEHVPRAAMVVRIKSHHLLGTDAILPTRLSALDRVRR